jgi:hypothetical protein
VVLMAGLLGLGGVSATPGRYSMTLRRPLVKPNL